MNIHNRNLDAYRMPFTANRRFKAEPKMLSGAKGMYYPTDDGRQIIDVTPDLFTIARRLTNRVVPMGAVFVQQRVHEALMQGLEDIIELFHGYTYSGLHVTYVAGLAVLDIYESGGLLTLAADLKNTWQETVHSLRDEPNVIDIRNRGLIGGIELSPRDGDPGAGLSRSSLIASNRGL